jgi:hypothetical protein
MQRTHQGLFAPASKSFLRKGKSRLYFLKQKCHTARKLFPPQIKETLIFSRFLCILSSRVAGWKKRREKKTHPACDGNWVKLKATRSRKAFVSEAGLRTAHCSSDAYQKT